MYGRTSTILPDWALATTASLVGQVQRSHNAGRLLRKKAYSRINKR